ncbi:BTB/POZ and MATH domain-containing protein 1 [Setaria viridis]|uniref:BTB/POZ and MATH domain-containing protein 1 n=1 Tax=Setaria viridis TaxID=4556 RepID=UPI00149351A3|nr:BTB/POZ and MATH domain-containing protein 1-like [Setaria viridis]
MQMEPGDQEGGGSLYPFEAVGHRWRIKYHPNVAESWWRDGHISLYLELEVDSFYGVYRITDPVDFKFTLLDQAGNPVYSRGVEAHVFSNASRLNGFKEFIKWKDLAMSGCLKDDTFTVRCDITVFEDWTEEGGDGTGGGDAAAPVARVVVPPSDLREHLNKLLWKKQGTDVMINVAGETFEAHGWLLMARSPAFEAELLDATATKEKLPGGARRRMEIKGVEPKVFKEMLHFMYTDALPEMEEEEVVAMAQGLLAAAHRFKLERLKLMCEEMLCKRIDVNTVVGTLAVAEENGCHALKAACLEFIAHPENMKAVMETEGFQKIKGNCLALMLDVVMKQLA